MSGHVLLRWNLGTILFSLSLAAFALPAQDLITFQVDMSVQLQAGYFDPVNEGLHISGAHNGWCIFTALPLNPQSAIRNGADAQDGVDQIENENDAQTNL